MPASQHSRNWGLKKDNGSHFDRILDGEVPCAYVVYIDEVNVTLVFLSETLA